MTLGLKKRFKLSRFIRGEKATQDNIRLNHRRIFILPTRSGLGFVLLIFILLLIAFIYNNNLAYLLTFLLASVFFITILHSFKSLASLVFQVLPAQAVFAGESVGFTVLVNNSPHTERLNLQLKLEDTTFFSLKKHQQKSLILYCKVHKRGWHNLQTITISSTFPLGFFRAWSPLRFTNKILIYPKPSQAKHPFPESSGQSNLALNQPSLKGHDDFYGLKEYQAGDPIKHIHWKAFAKGQGLHSKQYENSCQTDLCLNYEQAPGHNVEEKLSQLCRWVIDAETAGLSYSFTLPHLTLPKNQGKAHYEKCLKALALF